MNISKTFLQKLRFFAFALLGTLIFQFCQTSKQSISTKTPIKVISYEADIKPIMVNSCTPCHFPEQGRKKMLDTYEATASNIEDILKRIQLPTDSAEFMPFKSKRVPLTSEEIQLMKEWVALGMAK